jgi:hypothetical protein
MQSLIPRFYRMLLSSYVIRYVEAEPPPPTVWKLPVLESSACKVLHRRDCTMLNVFLQDLSRNIERFK